MTTLREAAAMALMAMPHKQLIDELLDSRIAAAQEIERLRAELFEALCKRHVEAEPVAYGYRDARGNIRLLNHYETKMDRIPLYTSPPQRQPLTDEEIDALAIDEDGLPNSHFEFARAIERAHGIGADR